MEQRFAGVSNGKPSGESYNVRRLYPSTPAAICSTQLHTGTRTLWWSGTRVAGREMQLPRSSSNELVLEDHWSLRLCNWVACEPVCTGGLPLSFQVLRSGPVGWNPFVRIKRLEAHETWATWSAGMSLNLKHDVPRPSQGWSCLCKSRNILYFKATRSWTS